ncbi:hypothetical protein GGX14DRAFT_396302 [Mycena pura]|uniref:Uncharacterized protein n=1 Tax=Mycena pura TaxID=153505 RepID=A0AAD6VCK9_9AGAR|nr:hypothetical protein GGX14DRAFT_396302 [Mycena pura]
MKEERKTHAAILEHEKPNYVVLNGDLITGENVFAFIATKYLDWVFAPTVARKIPFSSTHGNHPQLAINHQVEIESAFPALPADTSSVPTSEADFYWVDEKTVPQYIKQERALMSRAVQKADVLAPLPSVGDHDDEPDPATHPPQRDLHREGPVLCVAILFYRRASGTNARVLQSGTRSSICTARASNMLAVTSGHDHGESWCAR